jgi:hypothetical protein
MKQRRFITSLFVLFVALAMTSFAWAAEGHVTSPPQGKGLKVYTVKCTTAANGSFAAVNLEYPIKGILWYIQTIPGTTNPTAATSVVLVNNGQSYTHLRTAADETKTLSPTFNGVAKPAPINGQVSLDITGNSVDSAILTVNLFVLVEE